jgi:hypothetical protein
LLVAGCAGDGAGGVPSPLPGRTRGGCNDLSMVETGDGLRE